MSEYMDDEEEVEVEVKNSRKLFGHKLRVYTVNAVRKKLEKEPLTEEQIKNESYVKGVFSVLKEIKVKNKKKTVAGATLVKTHNQAYQTEIKKSSDVGYKFKSAEERKNLLYGRKKEA